MISVTKDITDTQQLNQEDEQQVQQQRQQLEQQIDAKVNDVTSVNENEHEQSLVNKRGRKRTIRSMSIL
jgi:hypothetical protein